MARLAALALVVPGSVRAVFLDAPVADADHSPCRLGDFGRMIGFDTNVLVRLLVDDDEAQAALVRQVLEPVIFCPPSSPFCPPLTTAASPFRRSREPIRAARSSILPPASARAVNVSGSLPVINAAKGATTAFPALAVTKNTCALICGISAPSAFATSKSAV